MVGFDPAPARLELSDDTAVAHFDVEVEPGDRLTWHVRVAATRRQPSGFDAEPGADAVTWDHVVVTADDPRLAPLVAQSLDDLRHLLLRDPLEPADVFAAAGSPWYLTLFGRDSIWTARMMLPFGTELAAGTLRALARRQGTHDDAASAQQPGKIAHEVRRTAYESPREQLVLPPLYYGTVDATALWVCLLVDTWRWGLPEDAGPRAPAAPARGPRLDHRPRSARRRRPAEVPRHHRSRAREPGVEGLRRLDALPGRSGRRGPHRPRRSAGVCRGRAGRRRGPARLAR